MKILNIFYNKKTYIASIIAWIVFQIVWITLYSTDLWYSDFGLYQYYATICADHGTMYPDYSFYHHEYIFAPGWVNMLVLWYKLFGNFDYVPFLLLIFNVSSFYVTNLICKKISQSENILYTVGYLYILTPAFSTTNVILCSEISFIFFATLSLYLSLYRRFINYVLSALFIVVALWIRPLAWAWIISALFFFVLNKVGYKYILAYAASVFLFCGSIGYLTHKNFPDYLYTASTGGVNMIMGANDKATGGYLHEAREEGGLGYLPGLYDDAKTRPVTSLRTGEFLKDYSDKYIYSECDSIYKARSINWIVENPIKWCSTIPNKIKLLFLSGSYVGSPKDTSGIIDHIGKKFCRLFSIWQELLISIVFIISLIGIFTCRKWSISIYYIFTIIVITSAMTIACVVSPRYNHIMLNLLYVFFAMILPFISRKIHAWLR